MLLLRFVVLCQLVSCGNACMGGWTLVETSKSGQWYDLAESSLETSWENTSTGWCRAKSFRRTSEVTVGWKKENACLTVWRDVEFEKNVDAGSQPLMVGIFNPKEKWVWGRDSQILRGAPTKIFSIPHEWDLRPHQFWLSMPVQPAQPFIQFLRGNRKNKGVVSRNTNGHLKFESSGSIFEFDAQMRLVHVALQTKISELPKPERALPMEFDYTVATDRHGVAYCKTAKMSVWRRGGGGRPTVQNLFEVLEYDSKPDGEKLFFTYNELPLKKGTIVYSVIPSRPGRWLLGYENQGATKLFEKKLQNLGKKLRTKGFSARD